MRNKDEFSVLLIDDDTYALEITKSLITNAGISPVYTLSDSRKVLPFLQEHKVSLVVLDLVMPHFSGLDLLPQIRLLFPDLPVIVESASNDVKTAVECMKHGVLDYHVKPININLLIGSVKNALNFNGACRNFCGFRLVDQCM